MGLCSHREELDPGQAAEPGWPSAAQMEMLLGPFQQTLGKACNGQERGLWEEGQALEG